MTITQTVALVRAVLYLVTRDRSVEYFTPPTDAEINTIYGLLEELEAVESRS